MSDGSVIIDATLNDDDFKKALDETERVTKKAAQKMQGEVETVGETMGKSLKDAAKNAKAFDIDFNTESIDDAVKKLDNLNATLEVQRRQLENAQSEYDALTQYMDTGSERVLNLQKKILGLEKSLQEGAKKSDNLADAINDAERVMNDASAEAQQLRNETGKMGDEMDKAEESVSVLGTALQVLGAIGINSAVNAMNNLVDSTVEFRRELSTLETNANNAGVSMEAVSEEMANLYALTGETDSNLEAVSNLLASGFNENNLADAVNVLSGAVLKFPDTLKIEGLADGLQETLATGSAIGPFAELLDRVGINIENFNEGLARATALGREQEYVLETLAKTGLADVNEAWQEQNATLIESAKAQYELEEATAALGDALAPAKAKVDSFKASIVDLAAEKVQDSPFLQGVLVYGGEAASVFSNVAATISSVRLAFGGASKASKTLEKATKTLEKAASTMGKAVGSAAGSAGNLAQNTTAAGNAASQANMKFVSIAGGIAIMAAGMAVAVLAVSELVKAFGGTNENSLKVAGAVAIVMAAMTGLLAAMTALNKTVGGSSSQFLLYSVSITLVAAAFSLLAVAMAELVSAFGETDQNAMAVAGAIALIMTSTAATMAAIGALSKTINQAIPVLVLLTMTLLAMAAAYEAIAKARKEANAGKMLDMGVVPRTGYAHGTASARKGYNWVDETTSPRLLYFNGGEQVLTRSQSMARQNALNGGRTNISNTTVNFTIPADQVHSFVRLVDMAEKEYTQIQRGVVYNGG